jgi:hypothetical protein
MPLKKSKPYHPCMSLQFDSNQIVSLKASNLTLNATYMYVYMRLQICSTKEGSS